MTFKEASAYVMPLGKHKGHTLDAIASDDAGLKYLDWLRGQDWVRAPLRSALEAYLEDPAIKRDLEALVQG